jgi:hypothetical protein
MPRQYYTNITSILHTLAHYRCYINATQYYIVESESQCYKSAIQYYSIRSQYQHKNSMLLNTTFLKLNQYYPLGYQSSMLQRPQCYSMLPMILPMLLATCKYSHVPFQQVPGTVYVSKGSPLADICPQ